MGIGMCSGTVGRYGVTGPKERGVEGFGRHTGNWEHPELVTVYVERPISFSNLLKTSSTL
jgi:hypothetical protein